MPIKSFKPTTPARRFLTQVDYSELLKKRPEKGLIQSKPSTGGRNNKGRVTSRFRGGGHKRHYRLIDFRRDKRNVPAKVVGLEYDPNRTAHIALLNYADGEKRYILAPVGLKTGDTVIAATNADIQVGNSLPLSKIPAGTTLHNVELRPGAGGKMGRSAGSMIQLVGFEGGYAQLRMPSGEMRIVSEDCWATVGQVGNLEYENVVWGKAGRMRWRGFRPHNRGVSMNPVDHPLGGGEGKSSGGRHPVSPWGQKAKGLKTRNSKRTDRFIVRRRK
ncbi:MAG: 50S ribosomal protein L2 [Proteobacteria bacterium]|nr:50S ribosomal protein L2 [Pseudomonadota bacterium]NDG26360.1 50S ribosomal protein L2 [Pseudomonadota bacterium]